MSSKDYSKDPRYLQWLKFADRSLSSQKLKAIENLVRSEVDILRSLSTKERFLYMKRDEIERWYPSQTVKDILWVQRNIYTTRGKSDFRRIDPELVEVSDDLVLETRNIWGEPHSIDLKNQDSHKTHWDILRTLVSSAPNDGMVGRAIRFLVVDKTTRQYLGIICIGSAMFRTKSIHTEIGWNAQIIKKRRAKSGRPGLHNIANGQTIVPTQPFGSNFLGGKLLSLLCLSKEVADAWERKYGDKLVSVHTTSLFGSGDGTQYTNLNPYWRELRETTGQEAIKLTPTTYEQLKIWMRHKYPEKYFQLFEAKNEKTGMLETRESKSQALPFCYRQLDIKNYISGEKRGVYSSFLYSNAIDYLNERISADQLIPAFDNSINSLTEFWRFGSMGDTTKPTDELRKKAKTAEKLRMKINQKGMVKGRIARISSPMRTENDWYLPLKNLSWDEIRNKYGDQPAATQKLPSVP